MWPSKGSKRFSHENYLVVWQNPHNSDSAGYEGPSNQLQQP
jgi:hypothetical protein